MPKAERRSKKESAPPAGGVRRSLRRKEAPVPVPMVKRKPVKKSTKKEVEKAAPVEEAEAPAENGDAKDEAPSTDDDKKVEDAE